MRYGFDSEIYRVSERDDPEWHEYIVRLLDSRGQIVDEWNSLSETYNGQRLTKAECERAVVEIKADVAADNAKAWFTFA